MTRRQTFFITGTDTEVGKTFISCALLHALNCMGLTTLALKPVAAGCQATEEGLRNDDALALQSAMSVALDYDQINPVALPEPVSPHIAAHLAGRRLQVDRLAALCRGVLLTYADVALIEGAGGWRVPLNDRETIADLAGELAFPVILVVGVRLGCINHALLSAEAIRRDGLTLAGWVANSVDVAMQQPDAVYNTLNRAMGAPCLGRIGRQPHADWRIAAHQFDPAALNQVFKAD